MSDSLNLEGGVKRSPWEVQTQMIHLPMLEKANHGWELLETVLRENFPDYTFKLRSFTLITSKIVSQEVSKLRTVSFRCYGNVAFEVFGKNEFEEYFAHILHLLHISYK